MSPYQYHNQYAMNRHQQICCGIKIKYELYQNKLNKIAGNKNEYFCKEILSSWD